MKIEKLDTEYLEKCRSSLKFEQTNSLAETNNWEHVNKQQVHIDWDILYKEFALLIDNSKASDKNVQSLMERHFEITCRFYRPSREAYIGLALFYNDNQAMKDFHNSYHPKMVAFLGDSISIYAHENL